MTRRPNCHREMGPTAAVCPHCGYSAAPRTPVEWPFWVRLGTGMRTVPRRATAVAWFVVSLIGDLAVAALAYFWDRSLWWVAALFILCTLWNGLAIRWVDKRGLWANSGARGPA